MFKRLSVSLLILLLCTAGFLRADEEKNPAGEKENVPERITVSLDALLKTRTSNGIYSIRYSDAYFYVLQKSVFVNVLFTADLKDKFKILKDANRKRFEREADKYNAYLQEKEKRINEENARIREENKKIADKTKKKPLKEFTKPPAPVFREPDHYFNLYLRVVKGSEIIQRFKAPVPYTGQEDTAYFSFGIITEPGRYTLLIDIDAIDHSEDGTLLVDLSVPRLTLLDIIKSDSRLSFTRPRFYSRIQSLSASENRFTVCRNEYQIGVMRQVFHPFIGDKAQFNPDDKPILTFFIKGAVMKEGWNIETRLTLSGGKKPIVTFKPFVLKNPYFFQPVRFIDGKGKALPEGTYHLTISLHDRNSKGSEGELDIPFTLKR